eukprot:scaffold562715_cov53-Prasinocladus_malaysianus.AAC.1
MVCIALPILAHLQLPQCLALSMSANACLWPYTASKEGPEELQIPEATDDEERILMKRFICKAARLDGWTTWFEEQAGMAKASTENGLYIGLRLDGRVRASGKGSPPWQKFIREIAPMEGMWKGFLDGMDGVV